MNGDSRGSGDRLRRNKRALGAAVSLCALALGGCALSFEDADGERHVVGFYAMEVEAAGTDAPVGDVRHFAFYGLWLDDAFRGTSLALGEVEFSVADLRNQWGEGDAATRVAADACDGGFGFRWCLLGTRDPARAGEAFDIAISGITIGVGERDRHFGVGYHRQVLLEVTNENALVAWPSHVKLDGLLRGSING
jgi:hypothetical protein